MENTDGKGTVTTTMHWQLPFSLSLWNPLFHLTVAGNAKTKLSAPNIQQRDCWAQCPHHCFAHVDVTFLGAKSTPGGGMGVLALPYSLMQATQMWQRTQDVCDNRASWPDAPSKWLNRRHWKHGPWTSSILISQEARQKCRAAGSDSDPVNQDLQLNKVPGDSLAYKV